MANKSIANDSGASFSVWMHTRVPAYKQELPDSVETDVCVIGAGIAGITTAYLLGLEGRRVVVIDDGPIAGGETSRTTAHLASAQDDRFTFLERYHGATGIKLVAQSHAAAIDRIESICTRESIDCDFRRVAGYLFNPPGGSPKFLEQERKAAQRAGLVDVELLPRAPLPSFDTGPALRFPNQGQLDPLRYVRGLAAAVDKQGGHLYTGVRAAKLEAGSPACVVTAAGQRIRAKAVVVATNAPINSLVSLPLKQAAYRSYVVGFQVPKGAIELGLYWDTEDPYHYVRLVEESAASDVLIVGGEDHKTGQDEHLDPQTRFDRLQKWTRERFPMAGELSQKWSGQVMEPVDGVGFIGRSPGHDANVYLITGDSGQGMTHSTLGAMLVTDLIAGRPNPWEALYDPGRNVVRAVGEFLRENANVAAQYLDWLGKGDVASVDEIKPGAGAIVRKGARLLAVYRDEVGVCHARSAACTHLGGVVSWNALEKTWDCPCHGTRYSALGRVLNGPAKHDLAVAELKDES